MDSKKIFTIQKAGVFVSVCNSNSFAPNSRYYIFIKENGRKFYRFILTSRSQCLDATDSESFQFSSIAEYEIIK